MRRRVVIILSTVILFAAAIAAHDKAGELKLQQAIDLVESKGDLGKATPLFEDVAKNTDRALAARALLYLARAQERAGQRTAQQTYERLAADFADQSALAAEARSALTAAAEQTRRSERLLWKEAVTADFDGYALSPTGELVVMTEGRGLSLDLFVRDIKGGAARNLTKFTTDGEAAFYPTWSSDGNRVAYQFDSDEFTELRIVDVKSGRTSSVPNTRHAWSVTNTGYWPLDWSPDGRRLLVGVRLPKASGPQPRSAPMAWLSVQSGTVEQLEQIPRGGSAKVSPNGRLVAFASANPPGTDLRLLDVGSGQARTIVAWEGAEVPKGWLDDTRLAFQGINDGRLGLWIVSIKDGAASGPPVLVREFAERSFVSITRTGAILDVVNSFKIEIHTAVRQSDAATWTAGGPSAVPVQQISKVAAWSPDGSYLAWDDRRAGRAVVLVWSEQLHRIREIPLPVNSVGSLSDLVWTPNGQQLLLLGISGNEQAFYKVDVQSGSVARITPPVPLGVGARRNLLAMTPDERSYLSWGSEATGRAIWRVDTQTGTETLLLGTDTNGGPGPVAGMSPDGKWWAVMGIGRQPQAVPTAQPGRPVPRPSTGLMAVPVSGGTPRPLCGSSGDGTTSAGSIPVKWSPDSRSVFFMKMMSQGPGSSGRSASSEIWECSIDGGEARPTGIIVPSGADLVTSFVVHPDGRHITYSSRQYDGMEVWLYEGFFVPKAAALVR